jgi:uncharacterized protein YndB with AHSA1/START domain
MTTTDAARRNFTLAWTLDAPPAEVFRAWTDPDHLDWFFNDTNPIPSEPIELDLRVGGAWRQRMVIDESTNYMTGGVYREIVPDQKLVFAWGATGWPQLDPDRLDDSPLVTVTLDHVDGRTEMSPPATFLMTACRSGGRWSRAAGAIPSTGSPPLAGAPTVS